jgi:tight adherence protein C
VFSAGLADQHEVAIGIASGVACILAYSLPRVLLSARASGCTRQIEKGIPDALDMISMAVSGGIPIESAVARVAQQLSRTHRRLGQELQIVARQAHTGSVEQAFADLGKRLSLPEVAAWCALMAQSRRLGGKIVDALAEYANRIRQDRKNRAERSGNTASIKLLLPVVMCLSPPIAIMLIGPALLDFRDFINRKQTPTEVVEQLRESTEQPL